MTYWLILFQVSPVPPGAPGPIKLKVNRRNYEVVMQDANATIDSREKGKFIITGNKRSFATEDGLDCYIIADVKKIINE